MTNVSAETIHGSYSVVTMPDGVNKLVEKLSDGSWVFVDERLKDQQAFEARFADTTTIPNDWNPATEIQGLIKSKTISTKAHLMAHLIEVLGCPTDIIEKGLDPKKKELLRSNGAERATLLIIIRSINDPQWNKVANAI
jgi:hypothetical protein